MWVMCYDEHRMPWNRNKIFSRSSLKKGNLGICTLLRKRTICQYAFDILKHSTFWTVRYFQWFEIFIKVMSLKKHSLVTLEKERAVALAKNKRWFSIKLTKVQSWHVMFLPFFRMMSLRRDLTSICRNMGSHRKIEECLKNFLMEHEVGEEDPILLVDCLPQLNLLVLWVILIWHEYSANIHIIVNRMCLL